jgi:uncharacterized membrane protein
MLRYVVGYLGAGLLMAALDAVWLTVANARVYRPTLNPVLAETFRLGPAVLFYLIYLIGVTIFAIAPALREGQWTRATVLGALFGFFCYATYDLTNQATLSVWATRITLIDLTWGTFLTAAAATAGYFAARRIVGGP